MIETRESKKPSLRGAKRRSNPFFLYAERWIAATVCASLRNDGRRTGGPTMNNDIAELTKLNQRLRRLGAEFRRQALRRNPGAGFLLLQSRQVAGRPRRVSCKQTAMPVTIKNLKARRREDPHPRRFRHHPCRHQLHHCRTASRRTAATPIAGRSRTASGSRCQRMCRGEPPTSLPGLTRQSIRFEQTLPKIDGCPGQARA